MASKSGFEGSKLLTLWLLPLSRNKAPRGTDCSVRTLDPQREEATCVRYGGGKHEPGVGPRRRGGWRGGSPSRAAAPVADSSFDTSDGSAHGQGMRCGFPDPNDQSPGRSGAAKEQR